MSSTARKARIVERASPMDGVASEIADALNRLADEIACVGGSLSYLAAEKHSGTAGEQRQLAAVIFQTARKRFGGIKYDGIQIDQTTIEELDALWLKMLGKPGKR